LLTRTKTNKLNGWRKKNSLLRAERKEGAGVETMGTWCVEQENKNVRRDIKAPK
jgi:hypothetical protein